MTVSALVAITCISPLFGCINTSYSRADESVITSNLGHIIIGAFAHHGDAFYEQEVRRCLKALEKDPNDFEARNDLGAAHSKLGDWDLAKAAFDENERRHPGRYKTASNLGVMFKKQGKFKEAEKWIAKALEIKPGGHMGLGDYYLQMIRWRQRPAKKLPSKNFLGVPYTEGAAATAAKANREYVVTLIKNDYKFADAYIVLGDILFEEGDLQHALRAYFRAQQLKHPNLTVVSERFALITNHWGAKSKHEEGFIFDHRWRHQLSNELDEAATWLEGYQALEARRLADNLPVTFAAMKDLVAKPKIVPAGYYRGFKQEASGSAVAFGVLAIVLPSLVVIVIAIGAVALYFLLRPKDAPDVFMKELKP